MLRAGSGAGGRGGEAPCRPGSASRCRRAERPRCTLRGASRRPRRRARRGLRGPCAGVLFAGRVGGLLRLRRRGCVLAVGSRFDSRFGFSLKSVSLSVRSFRRGQRNAEDRPAPDGRVNLDATAVLRNNTITDGEAETGAAPDLLRREERVEDALAYLRRDALPRVAHLDADLAALLFPAQRPQAQSAALRHRVNGVLGEDDDGLLQLSRVAGNRRQVFGQVNVNRDRDAALLVREQTRRRLDDLRDVDGRVPRGARAAEVQKAVRDLLAPERLAADELEVLAQVLNVRARAVDALRDA